MPGRANEFLVMGGLRLRAAVGLLTGHTTLTTYMHILKPTQQQDCRLCGHDKEYSVHIVCHCPVRVCKTYSIWSSAFLKSKDLQKVKAGSRLSVMTNTELGLFP